MPTWKPATWPRPSPAGDWAQSDHHPGLPCWQCDTESGCFEMSGDKEKPSPRIAQTLDRGLELLNQMSAHPEGLSTAALAARLDVHRSIVHRLLATLERRALVARNADGTFVLGLGLVALAEHVSADLRRIARPYLEELAEATGETVHLVVRDGWDVLFLDGIESESALRVIARTGRRLPAHSTSVGKVLLARLDPEERAPLYGAGELASLTEDTIHDRDRLEAELEAVRDLGYATNWGESETSVGSVGAAVSGNHQLAISVAAPTSRLDEQTIAKFAALVCDVARRLGKDLGAVLP